LVFYPDEASSLSRVHCVVQLDGKHFVITDSNSSNGTRINGERLKPSDAVQLRDGDEVVLGNLGKLGVKLRFATVESQPGPEPRDRTYIIDDFDQQNWDKFQDQ
jgi:pSer/pThr/pTyr-binding forkhead associated (FHA) protein